MPLEGIQLGNYRLIRLIGSGSMGEIYLAEDVRIGRQIAVKVVRAETSYYPDEQEVKNASRLFQREMQAISMLDHPHILPLYDFGEQNYNNTPITYMVMPYRREGSLQDWLHRRETTVPLALEDSVAIIQQAADALQHAHNRQLLHLDVKPSNFLIQSDTSSPGLPYLLLSDFGVSKFSSASSAASQNVRGTPLYMPPEQWQGHPVPASDQYALAILTYQLLTGRPPFTGRMEEVMHQHFMVPPRPPGTLNPRIPPAVDAVIMRALAKKPEERFPSVANFARALQEATKSTHVQGKAGSVSVPETLAPAGGTALTGRSDIDIRATLAISQEEALSGASRTLTLPGGRRVSVNIPTGAYNGQVIHMENHGETAIDGRTGALILTLVIQNAGEHESPVPASDEKTVRTSSHPNISPTVASFSQSASLTPPPLKSDTPTPRSTPSKGKLILFSAIALIIIAGSVGAFFIVQSNQATARANATATTVANNATMTVMAANTTATASTIAFQTTATAQAQANATATASTITANPYPSYLPGSGTLALYDPLHDNTFHNGWDENNSCGFNKGVYHVTTPDPRYFYECAANYTNFSDFAYEVKLDILKGDEGGMIFRADPANAKYYFFGITRDGYFSIFIYKAFNSSPSTLVPYTQSSAINQGLNQTNTIALVAKGHNITLYINQQQVLSTNDSTFNGGEIGCAASSYGNANNSTDVTFSNARVWTY